MDPGEPRTLPYKRARFVTQLPVDYLYSRSHFWLSRGPEGLCRVGLTKFGSRVLGEMVDFGFEPALGAQVSPGQVIGWLEGFKAVSDLFCIAEGQFAGPNPELERDLTLINRDPYFSGWIYAVNGKPDPGCLAVEGYARVLDETIDKLLESA